MFERVNPEPSITHLFISFLRLGATAFGGPSMVAYIHKMAVEQKRWLDEKTFRDGVALCGFVSVPLMFHEIVEVRAWMDSSALLNGIVLEQVTPGSVVITATFIGYLLHGFIGGLIATISVFLPSFMMVIGSVPYFDRLRILPYFNKIICGILCSFIGLLLTVAFRFACGMSIGTSFASSLPVRRLPV